MSHQQVTPSADSQVILAERSSRQRPSTIPFTRDPSPWSNSSRTFVDVQDSRNGTEAGEHEGETNSNQVRKLELELALGVTLGGRDPKNLVAFKDGDPEDPLNWPNWRKWTVCAIVNLETFWVIVLASIFSPATDVVAQEFGVAQIVGRFGVAAYLLGFSIGPVFITPIAEDYGRKWTYTICMVGLYIFQIPCGVATNIQTIIICRFIGGCLAAPIYNACGSIPDLFHPDDPHTGWALNLWAFIAESTILGPLIGGYIVQDLGWRWIFWIAMIVGFVLMVPFLLFVPETRQDVLLLRRAKRLRKETGNQKLYAASELQKRTVKEILMETIIRPVEMLLTEPIVFFFGLWDGLNYGIIYLAFDAFPLVYEQYGFTPANANLTFIAVLIGYILAIPLYAVQRAAVRRIEKKSPDGHSSPPEAKLIWGFFGVVAFPISLYWFAWTSHPPIPWIVSVLAAGLFGISSHILYFVVSDYTVSSYATYASSAVTAQALMQDSMAAALTLVGDPFYKNVGYSWASCILAIIATPMAILPFVFWTHGEWIRSKSKFAEKMKKYVPSESTKDSRGSEADKKEEAKA